MGKGKLKKFSELETFSHVIQAPYRDLKNADHYLKGNWNKEFFKNDHPLVVELGCGKGEYTVSLAEKFPEFNYIGVDIKGARMWKGAKESFEKDMPNVGFIRTNIEIAGCFFASGEVSEIWLTFPDPQMKKTNKRLTSTAFISRYSRFLADEGKIHLKTDSNFQYQYTLAMVQANNFEILTQTEDLYNSELLDEKLQIKTFYERQWLQRDLTIKYLAFKIHKNEPYIEPNVDIEKDDYRSFGRNAVNFENDE